MSKLDLRLRDLKSGEAVNAMFESEDDARTFLLDRPRFTQVLGVATHGLPESIYKMLRAAVRPLDPEEEERRDALEQAAEDEARHAEAIERAREELELRAHREAMKRADPNRPMTIAWTRSDGMRIADPADPREITAIAREAVLGWIAEREAWVRDRGQVVGEAEVTVWPGVLPRGVAEDERVHPGGQFFPAVS
jgi:hypothetical protein